MADEKKPDAPEKPPEGAGEAAAGEESVEEEEVSIYDPDDYMSGPSVSSGSRIPLDILSFYHNVGYDCKKKFNLAVIDPETLIFANGNYINIFYVKTQQITFRRTALGGGVGSIKINPAEQYHNHIAIAEHGYNCPGLIIIYEWPKMDINCVLRGGTSQYYSHIDYSPDGMLLASQGGEPDYMLTIFNWTKHKILLRTKSYVNDVYRVKFSPFLKGELTTCGIAHIKFWKMANTFTGLKLKGEVGKFGKTEFSDIIGCLPMPDQKVCSGCSWGNILIWDDCKISLEVLRPERVPCHTAPIVELFFDTEGILYTISMDGHVKCWFYENIDQADPPDYDRVVMMEPSYDFYTPGASWMCLRKRYVQNPDDFTFFGQDGNGGIWLVDLTVTMNHTQKPSQLLLRSHAGKIMELCSCPWGPYIITLGEGGRLFLYDYLSKKVVFRHAFPTRGSSLIWYPPGVTIYGDEILVGFEDGTIRSCVLFINRAKLEESQLLVLQITKPFDGPVIKMTLNEKSDVLVAAGSDCTIFFFHVVYTTHCTLVPIGFMDIPNPVSYFRWNVEKPLELIMGTKKGDIIAVEIVDRPVNYTRVSYRLKLKPRFSKFKSYKSIIRRNEYIAATADRKARKLERKMREIEQMRADGIDVDIEEYLEDSEDAMELEPLYFPKVPNAINWIEMTEEGNLILSMGGYDAGYFYEYGVEHSDPEPLNYYPVVGAEEDEIYQFIYNWDKRFSFYAMKNGEIRVNRLRFRNILDVADHWMMSMHDNVNSYISSICLSYDERFFFSAGYDGNLFMMKFNPGEAFYIPAEMIPIVEEREELPQGIKDKDCSKMLSIERESLKREEDRINMVANANKAKYRENISKLKLKFKELLARNSKLLATQQLPRSEMDVDPRVSDSIRAKNNREMDLLKRKMAFDIQKSKVAVDKLKRHLIDRLENYPFTLWGCRKRDLNVKLFVNKKITDQNLFCLAVVDEQIRLDKERRRIVERAPPQLRDLGEKKKRERGLEYFLLSLSRDTIEKRLGVQLTRLLEKYRARDIKWDKRQDEWEKFLAEKPKKGVNKPEDIANLAYAEATIGDFKLKSSPTYKIPADERETTLEKYKQLLEAKLEQFELRHQFNAKLLALREKKKKLLVKLDSLKKQILEIQKEMPPEFFRKIPEPLQPLTNEFPEDNYEELPEFTEEFISPKEVKVVISDVAAPVSRLVREKELIANKEPCELDLHPRDILELDYKTLREMSKDDSRLTVFESVLAQTRYHRNMIMQFKYIERINSLINSFDDELEELYQESYKTTVDARWMDHHVIMLNQQLMVLQDFESIEDNLTEIVHRKRNDVFDMQDDIQRLQRDILHHQNEIEKQIEEGKAIQNKFTSSVQDNKFFDFLRRVFKKKYKPPKVSTGEESSSESESESSSSEEEEEGSVDSRDFNIIKLDLNECPKGCELAIYNLAIKLRNERYDVEAKIRDEQKEIETIKKTVEFKNKEIKQLNVSLKTSQAELERYQKTKQSRLNEIRCLIQLHLHQMQNINAKGEEALIPQCLVFSQTRLSRLYKRVLELDNETGDLRKNHQGNVRHLLFVNKDIRFMEGKIRLLKEELTTQIRQKFGTVVDVNKIIRNLLRHNFIADDIKSIEEVPIKKFVNDLRMKESDIAAMFATETKLWRDKHDTLNRQYLQLIQDNTDRVNLLGVMTHEKADLIRFLRQQDRRLENLEIMQKTMSIFQDECNKLQHIVDVQDCEIEDLRRELKCLRLKGLPPKPPRLPCPPLPEEPPPPDEPKGEEEDLLEKYGISRILPRGPIQYIKDILYEMLCNLHISLTQHQKEIFISYITNQVLNRVSMTVLVREMVDHLPLLDQDQLEIVESTAESLLAEAAETTDEEENICQCLEYLFRDIIQNVVAMDMGPGALCDEISSILEGFIPREILEKKTKFREASERLCSVCVRETMKKEQKIKLMNDIAKELIGEIVEDVFSKGTDYMYIHDDPDDIYNDDDIDEDDDY